MEQVNDTIGNNITDSNQSNNKNGMVIVMGSCITIFNFMYPLIQNMGFAICAMETDADFLDGSRLPESNKLYLNGRTEEERIFSENVDMQTFEFPTIHLIKNKIMESVSEVVYLMVYLGYKWTNRLVLETAKASKELGKIVVLIIAMPAKWEKIEDTIQAKNAFKELKLIVDTSFVFYRDTFEEDNPDIYEEFSPLELATHTFKLPFKVIHNIINQKGEIIVDGSDVKTLLKSGAFSAVGSGQCNLPIRISIIFEQILDSHYLKFLNKEKCNFILYNMEASEQNAITMEEIEEFNQLLRQQFGSEVNIIVGLKNDNSLDDKAKVVCLFSFSEHELLSNL